MLFLVTTSGFTTDNFSLWPGFLPYLLLVGAFMGACSQSVGGGIKAWRVLIMVNQAYKEILKTIHPNAVLSSKIGTKVIDAKIAEKVWGFFSIYVFIFMFLLMAMLGTGLGFETAFSAVGACLNNLGPGLGDVSNNYSSISELGKFILCFAMILGRLEIFTLLVLFTPAFFGVVKFYKYLSGSFDSLLNFLYSHEYSAGDFLISCLHFIIH